MNTHRTECRAVEDLLVALSAGELESELTTQLRAHLDDCADCRGVFAEINRAQHLAVALKLASPELASSGFDRYPEFLRRLAASEAQAAREAEFKEELVPPSCEIVALAAINPENELAASATAQAGAAAVIPLFGNRLAIRSGFGRGFDLQITSRQNRELFHLSANSLAKAAAVVAGFGVFAAASLFVLTLLIVQFFRQAPETDQRQVQPKEHRPQSAETTPENLPWLQTAVGEKFTLSFWKAGNQIQAAFFNGQDVSPFDPFILITPPMSQSRLPLHSRITDCSLATDGNGFVVVREQSSDIFAWHLQPSPNKPHPPTSEPPVTLSNRGFQPAIAWAGDRYLVVWIEPDPNFPKIKMIELGKDGRPLHLLGMAGMASVTVAETESNGEKLGTPSIVAQAGRAMIVYQKQGGVLMARLWDSIGGLSELQIELLRHKAAVVNRALLAAVGETYFLCWGENYAEGAELRLARINLNGKVEKTQTLAVSRMPILNFDFKAVAGGLSLAWSEAAAGGAQIFARRFSVEGNPSTRAANLTPSEAAPFAFAFADAEGKAMIWHDAHPTQGQLPIAIRRIEWKE